MLHSQSRGTNCRWSRTYLRMVWWPQGPLESLAACESPWTLSPIGLPSLSQLSRVCSATWVVLVTVVVVVVIVGGSDGSGDD